MDVGNLLMRTSLANDSPSATVVLQSLFALWSVHRDGLQSQAVDLKIAALRSLANVLYSLYSVEQQYYRRCAGGPVTFNSQLHYPRMHAVGKGLSTLCL